MVVELRSKMPESGPVRDARCIRIADLSTRLSLDSVWPRVDVRTWVGGGCARMRRVQRACVRNEMK